MKCKYDDETLRLIALAIGTAYRYGRKVPDHYLTYLALKLVGKDGLSLDSENKNLYERLKRVVKELEE